LITPDATITELPLANPPRPFILPPMKNLLLLTAAVLLCTAAASSAKAPDAGAVFTKEQQQALNPAQALDLLKEGNERFVEGVSIQRDLREQATATAGGQFPFAAVVNCLDSRASAELVFDQGLGDIFNARIAGNIVNDDILGSLEFACKVVGAKLIAVIGHTSCGAVNGAVDKVDLGNLTGLLQRIEPAVVEADKQVKGERTSKDAALVAAVTVENVLLQMKNIRAKSPILKEMLDKGQIALVGGVQDLGTGKVTFLDAEKN